MGKTVLVVEDNADSRTIYATALEHNGYLVLQAEDGAEGVRLAFEHKPDMILMNLGLPLINGVDATELLKSDPKTAEIPLVIISAHLLPNVQEQAWQAGCDDYLFKPLEPTRVVAEVAKHIGPAGGNPAAPSAAD